MHATKHLARTHIHRDTHTCVLIVSVFVIVSVIVFAVVIVLVLFYSSS